MYQSILVATDGSELANIAVSSAAQLAKTLGSQLTVVTVTERWPLVEAAAQAELGVKDPVGRYEKMMDNQAAKILSAAQNVVSDAGHPCETLHVPSSEPAPGIIETADKVGADLIVLSSHGRRGLTKILLGSVATEVLTKSKVPVLVCR